MMADAPEGLYKSSAFELAEPPPFRIAFATSTATSELRTFQRPNSEVVDEHGHAPPSARDVDHSWKSVSMASLRGTDLISGTPKDRSPYLAGIQRVARFSIAASSKSAAIAMITVIANAA